MSSPTHAALMLHHLSRMLEHNLNLRAVALLYFLADQTAPVGHRDIVNVLRCPDSSSSLRAIMDHPVALGFIERSDSVNRLGIKCYLYSLSPQGRRLLRLPTVNSEPKTANPTRL